MSINKIESTVNLWNTPEDGARVKGRVECGGLRVGASLHSLYRESAPNRIWGLAALNRVTVVVNRA